MASLPLLVAIIPAYNEDRFIGSLVIKVREYVDHVIVVDDGSSDLTGWVAETAGAIVLRHKTNQGKGSALNTGLAEARDLGADCVILLDGDAQHFPEDIPELAQPILSAKADMAIGSRFLDVESTAPWWRVAGQRVLNWATNLGSGVRVTDTQSGFRALSSAALQKVVFRERGFSAEAEMQFLAKQHRLGILEVPISVNYDEEPKRNPVSHGLQVLNGILRLVGQHRPLLYFGVPGLVVTLSGALAGVWVVKIYLTFTSLAIGYALLSVLLTMVGTTSIFTGITLHSVRSLMSDSQWPKGSI